METEVHDGTNLDGVPASLSPESMDRLADLVIAKLMANGSGALPSKQVVAGSSPVSRSTKLGDYLPRFKRQGYDKADGDNLPKQEIVN